MSDTKLTEWEAQKALCMLYHHHLLKAPNIHFHDTEMDFCLITDSGFVWEIEIKCTLSDWKNDAHKKKWNCEGGRASNKVARFFYAVPTELLDKIPEFVRPETGIIELFQRDTWRARIHRDAKVISDYRATDKDERQILMSIYYRYWPLRHQLDIQRKQQFIEAIA